MSTAWIKAPAPGIYPGVPFADYLRWDAVNIHSLSEGARTMAHLHAALYGEPDEPTPAMRLGTAFHTLTLEPDKFDERVAVRPEFSGKGSVAAREEWEAGCGNRIVISRADSGAVIAMSRAVTGHPGAAKLLRLDGPCEVSVVWIDRHTGLVCKGRIDKFIPGVLALDLKTTRDAGSASFEKDAANMGYHRQVAFYADGFAQASGRDTPFVVVAVENEPPHGVCLFNPDDEFLMVGRSEYRLLLDRCAGCIRRGEWPGYPTEVQTLGLPRWYRPISGSREAIAEFAR